MIKQEIRSLIRNSLPKYDKTGRWGDRYINAAIEKALAEMMTEVWMVSPLNLQRYTKEFAVSTLDILPKGATSLYYAALPESIIPFQDKASGVRRITTLAQGGFTFFPMDFREIDLIQSGCYFKTVNTKIGYAVNQDQVEFYNMDPVVAAAGIYMDLIIPFSKYDEDDEVKIPEITQVTGTNYQKRSETFVDRVMAILGVVAPVDIKDDNASTVGGQKDN
jgi:hypothetical protein